MSADPAQLTVRITRYDRNRLVVVQGLIPLTTVATIVARRTAFASWSLGIAAALLGATTWQLRRAVGRLGWQTLRLEAGKLRGDTPELCFGRDMCAEWTMQGPSARLYGHAHSYKLVCRRDAQAQLEASLRSVLGAPIVLSRRGSPRARRTAALAAGLGALAIPAGILLELIPLFGLGLVALLLGLATFGALSQRVRAAPSQT